MAAAQAVQPTLQAGRTEEQASSEAQTRMGSSSSGSGAAAWSMLAELSGSHATAAQQHTLQQAIQQAVQSAVHMPSEPGPSAASAGRGNGSGAAQHESAGSAARGAAGAAGSTAAGGTVRGGTVEGSMADQVVIAVRTSCSDDAGSTSGSGTPARGSDGVLRRLSAVGRAVVRRLTGSSGSTGSTDGSGSGTGSTSGGSSTGSAAAVRAAAAVMRRLTGSAVAIAGMGGGSATAAATTPRRQQMPRASSFNLAAPPPSSLLQLNGASRVGSAHAAYALPGAAEPAPPGAACTASAGTLEGGDVEQGQQQQGQYLQGNQQGQQHGQGASGAPAPARDPHQQQRQQQQQQQQHTSHAAGHSGGSRYERHQPHQVALIMELVEGGNLSERIHSPNQRRMEVLEVLQVLHDITSGLLYLHPSVIHRDLKPQNVLLDRNGRAKLADFGISRTKDPLKSFVSVTHQGGTPNYMAPELFNGTRVDEKCDVYSMGCIVYECLTRKVPFEELAKQQANMGLFQIILAVAIKGQRPSLSPDLPLGLRSLITACWREDPRKRPGCAEVLKSIEDMIQAELDKRSTAVLMSLRRGLPGSGGWHAGGWTAAAGAGGIAGPRAAALGPVPVRGQREEEHAGKGRDGGGRVGGAGAASGAGPSGVAGTAGCGARADVASRS